MNRKELLLVCLAEECAELAKVASKSLRFGLDSDNLGKKLKKNSELLQEEFSDIVGIMRLLMDEKYIEQTTAEDMEEQVAAKGEKFEKMNKYSESLGLLKE